MTQARPLLRKPVSRYEAVMWWSFGSVFLAFGVWVGVVLSWPGFQYFLAATGGLVVTGYGLWNAREIWTESRVPVERPGPAIDPSEDLFDTQPTQLKRPPTQSAPWHE